MMEKGINYWHAMSDPALLEMLGVFIRETRLQQNKTQQEVASAAGVNRSTVVQIENGGGGTLLSFVQILRGLGQLTLFENFEVKQPQISPLEVAKLAQNKRLRASRKKGDLTEKSKSDW
jgi:transcriptional regulator with XRE-family HTH domain